MAKGSTKRKDHRLAKRSPAVSKRSEKKFVRRKVENAQRRDLLISSFEKRRAEEKAAAARTAFSSSDLSAALELVASAPSTKKKEAHQVSGKTNRGKRLILASETAQLGAVLADPTFQADPLAAICQHLHNSLPAAPSGSGNTTAYPPQKRKTTSRKAMKSKGGRRPP